MPQLTRGKYISEAQQRVLQTLDVLFGHEFTGIAPGQIAKKIGTCASNSTRDLANLSQAGFAEEIEGTGHWRISVKLGQKALAILNEITEQARKVDELQQRYREVNALTLPKTTHA